MKRLALFSLLVACKSEPQPTTVIIAPTAAASQSATPGTLLSTSTGDDDACSRDSDCTWGEIPIEITRSVDCMCLLGCPGLAQSTATKNRRQSQYAKLCKPGMDGHGNGCPIDDCAPPPPIKCASGHCKAARAWQ